MTDRTHSARMGAATRGCIVQKLSAETGR